MEDATPRYRFTPQLVVGLSIMAVGALLQLQELGLLRARHLLRYWPVILIAIGLSKLVSRRPGDDVIGPSVWMAGGALLLGRQLHLLDAALLGPMILILVGAAIVARAFDRSSGIEAGSAQADSRRQDARCCPAAKTTGRVS